ncbi:hypothetical protein DWX43_07530 [Clostridium sp. AF19-22AC]|uniref:hypothetical protein n=1 Tax=Clostridia TaxID=186801 RepID=UPI000E514704|nr:MULTISPECIES: hypothetical protein [Clostridia]RHR30701.1 hypothetical protein DWX43_07530 [Clostridium sp. AF19-22AC]
MKKIGMLLCTLLLITGIQAGTGETVFAEAARETTSGGDMELNAEVPKEHTVSVESPEGRIAADGVFYETSFQAQRHAEIVYTVIPNPAKQLKMLTYAGEDVTSQVKNGVFKAPKLVRDTILTAVYEDAPKAPDERTYNLTLTVLREDTSQSGAMALAVMTPLSMAPVAMAPAATTPVAGVTVSIGTASAMTDADGKAVFEKISSGIHQVIITDADGKLIGHMELTIASAKGTDLILDWDDNGNPIITPAKRTKQSALTLWLTADGRITVKEGGVSDTTLWPKPSGGPADTTGLKTGDDRTPALWFILLILSGAGLMGALVYRCKHTNVK